MLTKAISAKGSPTVAAITATSTMGATAAGDEAMVPFPYRIQRMTRELNELIRLGLIKKERRTVTVPDLAALEELLPEEI